MYGSLTWTEYQAISSTEYTGVNEIIKPGVVSKLKEALAKLNAITAAHGPDHQILPLRVSRIAGENIGKEKPNTFTTNIHNNRLLKELNYTSTSIYFTYDFEFKMLVDTEKSEYSSPYENIPLRKSKKLNIVDDFKNVICSFYKKKSYPRGLNWELLFNELYEIVHNDSVEFKIGESLHFISFLKDVFQVLVDNRSIKLSDITINKIYLINMKMSTKAYGNKKNIVNYIQNRF